MKIPAIWSILKKKKSLRICHIGENEQYVTDGVVCYNISCLPKITPEQLLTIMGVPEDKMSEYHIDYSTECEEVIRGPIENGWSDVMLERSKLCITYMGGTYEPLHTSKGVIFIDFKFLKPFDGVEYDLYERHSIRNNTSTIAIKAGFLLLGIISPVKIISEDFCESLFSITNSLCGKFDYKQEDENCEQQSFDFSEDDDK